VIEQGEADKKCHRLTGEPVAFHSRFVVYDFSNLSHPEFEDLARDLVGRALGVRFEAFAEGPDDGMDGRFAAADGATVLQAKHYLVSGFATLRSKMAKERAAIDRLQPSRYILVTSAKLTPKNKSALAETIGPWLLSPEDIVGPGDLNALLRQYPNVEKAHHRLWSGSTVVLENVVTGAMEKALNRPVSTRPDIATLIVRTRTAVDTKLASAHLALKFDPAVYVKRSLEQDVETWLTTSRKKTSTCFVVLAPAGSGKTNLLCRLAHASSIDRPTVLLIGSQLRFDAKLGIWPQILEACGIPVSQQSRSELVEMVRDLGAQSPSGFAIVFDAINEHPDPVALKHELATFLPESEQGGIHVLISCRDYYWGLFDAGWWAHFVRSHQDERKATRRVLGNFSPEEANQAFRLFFHQYGVSAQPQGNALEQFRHPLLLRFFCETYRGEALGRLRDIRLKDLFDTYWDRKLGSIAERMIDQGLPGVQPELRRLVGRCILDIAAHMLSQNVRSISVLTAQRLSHSEMLPSQLQAAYGRILDEHIVLEELDDWGTTENTLVAFVFEEFMEYAMARAMLARWRDASLDDILAGVVAITERYDDFSQVLGVVLYLALMLKEERDIALWSTLIDCGPRWEKVIIEAFKRLPADQIDDSVFAALIDLLRAPHSSTRIEALELLKFGRLRRIPTPSLIAAVGDLVTSDDLRIRRRALLALGSCPAEFAIPLIEKAITIPMRKVTHAYEVAKNAATSLVKLERPAALPVIALMFGGFWRYSHNGPIPPSYVQTNLAAVYDLLKSNDMVIRLGAVRMLRLIPSREILAKLEAIVADLRSNPPAWRYADSPEWVKVSGSYYLYADMEGGRKTEHYEIESALHVIRDAEMRVGWSERTEALHRRVDALIADPDTSPLREAIPELEYDSDAVLKLLQTGLDKRQPDRWKVTKERGGFLIRPKSRKRGELSSADRRDLAHVLGREEQLIWREGESVSTGMRSYNFWKEYIYRCWGWDPAVKGYIELD
jgi:hypothetical protein